MGAIRPYPECELVRLFGLDIRRTSKQAVLAAPTAHPVSRRSYDGSLGISFGKTVAEPVDLTVYDVITNSMPFVDRAFRTLARMIAPFEVTSDVESTADALNMWLQEELTTGYIFRGFGTFARSHIRQVLQYGKSAGEIVLAASKRDVESLHIISSKTVRLIKDAEFGLLIGQETQLGAARAFPNQDLIVYTTFDNRGDNPHGASLLRSVPWVANNELRIQKALEQMHRRSGAPSFFVHAKFPLQIFGEGIAFTDEKLAEYRAAMESAWMDAQEARWNSEGIIDFFAADQADVTMQAIGSDVKELNFEIAHRSMTEQIVAAVELAPFMLGIQWSTTERLSQNQADQIIGMVDDVRHELEPDWLQILEWVKLTRGLRGEVQIAWQDVNLRDAVETAQAELTEAQAAEVRRKNALSDWANGYIDQGEAKLMAGYDNDDVAMELDVPVLAGSTAAPGTGLAALAEKQWAQYP